MPFVHVVAALKNRRYNPGVATSVFWPIGGLVCTRPGTPRPSSTPSALTTRCSYMLVIMGHVLGNKKRLAAAKKE